MADRAWKAFERRCARDVGTERIPVTGERAGADFEDERVCYQAKLGRRMPSYLRVWLDGILGAAARRTPPKVGCVLWKPKGAKDDDALVLLRWRDWLRLHTAAESVENIGTMAVKGKAASCWLVTPTSSDLVRTSSGTTSDVPHLPVTESQARPLTLAEEGAP